MNQSPKVSPVPGSGQGRFKAPPRQPEIVEIGAPPVPADRAARLRARVLEVVRVGIPRYGWPDTTRQVGWFKHPGAAPWHDLRQRVGGRVRGDEFRGAVESLLASGELLELWLAPRGAGSAGHVLIIPG